MTPILRFQRLMILIEALRAEPPKSPAALAKQLDVSVRSVYRYLEELRASGFVVDQDEHGRYRLVGSDPLTGLRRRW